MGIIATYTDVKNKGWNISSNTPSRCPTKGALTSMGVGILSGASSYATNRLVPTEYIQEKPQNTFLVYGLVGFDYDPNNCLVNGSAVGSNWTPPSSIYPFTISTMAGTLTSSAGTKYNGSYAGSGTNTLTFEIPDDETPSSLAGSVVWKAPSFSIGRGIIVVPKAKILSSTGSLLKTVSWAQYSLSSGVTISIALNSQLSSLPSTTKYVQLYPYYQEGEFT